MVNVKAQWGAVLAMSAMLLTIISGLFLPLETAGALYMGVFFLALGIVGLSLMESGRDRDNLIKIFIAAYILRVVFTLLAYSLGIVELLGGADDTGWKQSWWIAQYWHGYENAPPNVADIPRRASAAYFLGSRQWRIRSQSRLALDYGELFLLVGN